MPLLTVRDLAPRSRADRFCALAQCDGRAVSSGRAAIVHALRLLDIGGGDSVLVPTYHCPTLVAPVLLLGAKPVFYPLVAPGVPDLSWLERNGIGRARAMIVPQLFGLPRDLSDVRRWCDCNTIWMVEDCAHSLFGTAGELLSGQWGDFATASLTKFLPVSELGWVYSSRRRMPPLALRRGSLRSEVKGLLDPIQIAAEHGRLGIIGVGSRALRHWRQRSHRSDSEFSATRETDTMSVEQYMRSSDLGRIEQAPSFFSRTIARLSDFTGIAEQRRRNYRRMVDLFRDTGFGSPLQSTIPDSSGPYAFPLLVDEPERIYPAMRRYQFPVYRWDRLWPGTPSIPGDLGAVWRYRLLQIPVHQSYVDEDFAWMASVFRHLRTTGISARP